MNHPQCQYIMNFNKVMTYSLINYESMELDHFDKQE